MSKTIPSSLRSSILASPWGSDAALVKLREGLVLKWYKDSEGYWTGGYGHLQRKGEDKLTVTQGLADKWLEEDLTAARKGATFQVSKLPFYTQHLYDVLVSVNFQLGTAWYKDFKNTWALMLEGDFYRAAANAKLSLWARQTPVRVRDFELALRQTQDLYDQYRAVGA